MSINNKNDVKSNKVIELSNLDKKNKGKKSKNKSNVPLNDKN